MSDGSAVIMYGVPARCVKPRSRRAATDRAVRIANCALPTCTTLFSESATFAAPAFTFAIVMSSCCCATRSCARRGGELFVRGKRGVVLRLDVQREPEVGR